jgi:hypothetical protein
VPVTAEPLEALTFARAGKPVKLQVHGEEAIGLAVRELLPRGDMAAWEVGLGGGRFELLVPDGPSQDGALERLLALVARMPAAGRRALRRVTVTEASPERLSYRLELVGRGERPQTFTISRSAEPLTPPVACGCPTCHVGSVCATAAVEPPSVRPVAYTISDGRDVLALGTVPGAGDDWRVVQVLMLWQQLPDHLRGLLKQVHVEEGANPTDADWGRRYNLPEFTSAASGGNGAATFWHGERHVADDVFFHEFGHVLGQAFSTTADFVPDGWGPAKEADATSVSTYGDASLSEDFAEAFAIFMTLRSGGVPRIADPPASLAEFEQRYPGRAGILQAIMRGERRPIER